MLYATSCIDRSLFVESILLFIKGSNNRTLKVPRIPNLKIFNASTEVTDSGPANRILIIGLECYYTEV